MCADGKEKTPLVTVIMPAYNAAPFVEEAIASVINQTLSDWELIVIDDCSKDNTLQVINALAANDSRIQVIQNDVNMGVAKTRNKGLDLFKGRYVALLDSDDFWKPCFLEKMIDHAQKTGADIVYCSYEMVNEQNLKVCNDFIVPDETTFEESIVRSVISCSTVLLTSEIAVNYRFPVNMYHEDIALWFQLLRDGKIARGVPAVLAAYRQRTESRSADKIASAIRRWPIYRNHLGLSLVQTAVVMIRYAYYGVLKFKRI
jgi:teichuronic acid biosynthesis glycosyltransferase TuaG